MMRISFARNVIGLAKPLVLRQVTRKFSQFRAIATLVNPIGTFVEPFKTTDNAIYRGFCTETAKKKKQKKNPPAVEHVGRLDLRVGAIVEVEKAPDADTLYLTKVDIGGEFLSIVAGLAKFIPKDQLLGKNVIILCNLKPSKLRGHLSEGMIMCAKSGDIMELLEPPANARPGDLVYCENYERTPTEGGRDKKRLYDPLAPDMLTNDQLVACYKGSYLYIPDKGNIVTKSLKNATIT